MKRSGFSLAAALLGTAYFLMIVVGFTNNGLFYDSLFGRSTSMHALFLGIAVAANWAGYISRGRDGILVAAIAYCIAAATFLLYAMFLVMPIVFSFIGFARTPKFEDAESADGGDVHNRPNDDSD